MKWLILWFVGLGLIAVLSLLWWGWWGFAGLITYIVVSACAFVCWAVRQNKGDRQPWRNR